jgi:hypothetical protein
MAKGLEALASGEAPNVQDEAEPETEIQEAAPAEQLDPLAYMLRVMNDPNVQPECRDRMAIAAAPFVHPRAIGTAKSKKELQHLEAQTAHIDAEWERLLG